MSAVVRAVLLERFVWVPPNMTPARGIVIFGRAGWSSADRRAEFKGWLDTIRESSKVVPAELKTRSRSRKNVRDPMVAQEWAWAVWDEYLAEIQVAVPSNAAFE